MSEVASAYVTLIPSFRGGARAIENELGPAAGQAGEHAGRESGEGFRSGFLPRIKELAAPIAGLFAVDKGVEFLKGAIEDASDLNESTTKLQQVFGSATDQVMQFGAGGAKAFGQTKNALLDASATFGVYGRAAGLSGKANAQFSEKLVGLSTDLASFYNTDPSEAVEALSAGLRGESEPLRKFGVLLDDATLRQSALRLGLIKNTKQALTPQTKALAAQAEIMRQTKVAQGDFARTSGGLANQQRILSAQFGNARAEVGKRLLPAMVTITTLLNSKLFPALGRGVNIVKGFVGVFKTGGVSKGLLDALNVKPDSPVVSVLLALSQAAWTAYYAVKGFIPKVQAGITAVKTAFNSPGGQQFFTQVTTGVGNIISAVRGLLAVVVPIIIQVVQAFAAKWDEYKPQILTAVTQIKAIIVSALTLIQVAVQRITALIQAVWQRWGATILAYVTTTFTNILHLINGVLTIIRGVIQVVTSLIKGDWSGVWNGIKTIFSGVWTAIKALLSLALNAMKSAMAAAWIAIKAAIPAAWEAIKKALSAGVTALITEVTKLPGQIVALNAKMLDAGKGLMTSLFSGLTSAAGAAGGFAEGIASAIWSSLKGVLNSVLPHSLTIPIPKAPDIHVPLFPKFAKGGLPPVGSPSIVGENGPELFVPSVPGRVLTATATRRVLAQSGGASAGPSTLVVIDSDGALIGRMQVEADRVVQGQARSVRAAGRR